MSINQKQLRKTETNRRRGWIIYILSVARPKPLDFATLIQLLDARDFPLSCRRFAEELDYLRSLGLLRVFPLGANDALSNVEQAKLIQRYCDSDGDMDDDLCASLTTKGVNFQEGDFEEVGIQRVN